MKKNIFYTLIGLLILCAALVVGLKYTNKGQSFIEEIHYSNLVDADTRKVLDRLLDNYGVQKERRDDLLAAVQDFNETTGATGLVESGFMNSKTLSPSYDFALMDAWEKKYPNFIGRNCRITSFGVLQDFLSVGAVEDDSKNFLFMDQDALNQSPVEIFSKEERAKFENFFASVPAQNTKDIQVHLDEVKRAWKERDLSMNLPRGLSLVTVWLHSDLDNILFVGHTGVLIKEYKGDILFLEKISFQEPYQLLRFKNRIELNDYLMNKYDTSWNQPTAKPFIMENQELLKGYRPNLKNTEATE